MLMYRIEGLWAGYPNEHFAVCLHHLTMVRKKKAYLCSYKQEGHAVASSVLERVLFLLYFAY